MSSQFGHYCWHCKRMLANEKFSGKGHANHLCKTCATELKQEARERRKNSAKTAQNR